MSFLWPVPPWLACPPPLSLSLGECTWACVCTHSSQGSAVPVPLPLKIKKGQQQGVTALLRKLFHRIVANKKIKARYTQYHESLTDSHSNLSMGLSNCHIFTCRPITIHLLHVRSALPCGCLEVKRGKEYFFCLLVV